jgi:plastocyanin
VAATAAAVGSAAGGTVVRTEGREILRANESGTYTMHFAPETVTVHSGGTVTFVHGDSTHDPHTITIVAARELPTRIDPCRACEKAQQAHFPQGPQGPPTPVVNVGRPGLDAPGDSVLWMSGRVKVKVSAPAGTVLRYFCAVHPWMQGTIRVVH